MIITCESPISPFLIKVEYEGKILNNVVSLNLETGEAIVYELSEKNLVQFQGDFPLTCKAVFDLTKLHVYLIKPKD